MTCKEERHLRAQLPELTSSEKTRYSRHITLPEVGLDGQRRLKAARVFIAGAGGLGCPAAIYLAAAGVGTIGIADFDVIDLSNLQRQILHSTSDVGLSKCQSVSKRLRETNPQVQVILHEERIAAENISRIISGYDIIIDATDNFSTRYLINDACVLQKKPNVYGAIYRFEGQLSVFSVAGGPCYRCLFPDPPPPDAVPNCAEGGVLGVLAGVIGVLQATEAIKHILSLGDSLSGKLLLYDALPMRFDILEMKRNPACPICGEAPTITAVSETTVVCCSAPEAELSKLPAQITVAQLQARLGGGERLCLIDVRTQDEYNLCRLPGSKLIPLAELDNQIDKLDRTEEIIVYCKSGGRSSIAAQKLIARGFSRVGNLQGGILSWIKEVDPSLPSC